ncbi:myosin IC heavy chain-like [Panicum virgatum]|uniref:myosin IC heavy chain-like n=1 Tax=Panicum virgatum TaxID=38727 RepID=UPI0019D57AB4|nr:myosin IC heavy chain-like [Panicum virgatum]
MAQPEAGSGCPGLDPRGLARGGVLPLGAARPLRRRFVGGAAPPAATWDGARCGPSGDQGPDPGGRGRPWPGAAAAALAVSGTGDQGQSRPGAVTAARKTAAERRQQCGGCLVAAGRRQA